MSSLRSVPGERFQRRYWRHRGRNGNPRSIAARVASLSLGALLAVLGVLMLVLPGPGILALAAAGALFASESLRIARMMDWLEVLGRRGWARLKAKFGR